MVYDPDKHDRRSIRLKEYDYSQPGVYYVTICIADAERSFSGAGLLFGEIINGEMQLNTFGDIGEDEWLRTPEVRPNVRLDAHIIMPDHLHGIVVIERRRGVLQHAPTSDELRTPSQTLGVIVRGFKGAATKRINHLRNTTGEPV